MYVEGQGVDREYIEAVRWYSMAAAQGNASAQFKLGAMYFQGAGVQEDRLEALRLIRMSAESGYSEAQNWLEEWGVILGIRGHHANDTGTSDNGRDVHCTD